MDFTPEEIQEIKKRKAKEAFDKLSKQKSVFNGLTNADIAIIQQDAETYKRSEDDLSTPVKDPTPEELEDLNKMFRTDPEKKLKRGHINELG